MSRGKIPEGSKAGSTSYHPGSGPLADGSARTAYERVRDQLCYDILSGAFAPGERLGIETLAKRYSISTTPARAALQELQGRGLVTMLPHQGARVRTIDADYVSNIYELRRVVLGLLVPRSIRFASDADIDMLEALELEFEGVARPHNTMRILRANQRFHTAVYTLARNPEALDVMNRTWLLIDALRLKFGYSRSRLDGAVAMHRGLIEAFRRRDATAAMHLLQESNDTGLKDLLSSMRQAFWS